LKAFILLLSGPSGAGKSTLLAKLLSEFKEQLYFSVSSTTRKPRADEEHGKDYYFISFEEFEKGIQQGYFLEWARVHQNYYGTSLKHTKQALEQGKIVIFDIDVQGFFAAKEKFKDQLVSIFVTTKDQKELKQRLIKRNADKMEILENRLENAKQEMEEIVAYDYLIVNENLSKSYELLRSILIAEMNKIKNQNLKEFQILWNKGE